ncbi:MAG: D-alanyl-D-alanine carboxypeptidase family protein [Rhodospirillaceae bacterium]
MIRKLSVVISVISVSLFALLAAPGAFALETLGKQVIMIDAKTNTVLFEKNADQLMPPSSMSKIMTIYKLFELMKDKRLSLEDTFRVSEKAWRKQGSKMFVSVNSRVKIEDLIRGIIVQSGNDATIVVAEGISGTESAFADELNELAKRLGMTNSIFRNASGWPDPEHRTTARDLAILAAATIRDFPEFYKYYGEKTFTYNGIKQSNRNPAIYRDIGADGLKTGHTEAAGYGLTASAERKGRRIILVINGLPSKKARSNESERLIDWAFRTFGNYKLFSAGEQVTEAEVWLGTQPRVPLVIEKELELTLNRGVRRDMKVSVVYQEPLPAPIRKGDTVAILKVELPGQENLEIPLVAGEDVNRLGLFSRWGASLKYILLGKSG